MAKLIATIRSLIFFLVFLGPFTIIWSLISIAYAWALPQHLRHRMVVMNWSAATIFMAKWVLGIRFEVEGRENIPDIGVVVCNHQSMWETIFLQLVFHPQSQVVKKSLLNIPFFGWAFRLMNPIAIDRSDRRGAIQQVLDQGSHLLQKGNYICVFPEGTRRHPDQPGRFSKGGAVLAQRAGVPVIPVSQNSGRFWINKKFVKYPGTVQVKIYPPIQTEGAKPEEVIRQAEQTILSGLDLPKTEQSSISPELEAH